jgi:CRP-like cAMP-binding protein
MASEYEKDIAVMTNDVHVAISCFFSNYPVRHYKKGHILLTPGEDIDYAYFLADGKIKMYNVSYRGDEIIVNSLKHPYIFPLGSILNGTPSRYVFEASSNITLRQAPTTDVNRFLDNNPKVVKELLSGYFRQSEGILKRLVYMIASSAKTRLLYALVMECHQFGEVRPDGSYYIEISEKELAGKAGLSRETVSREAKSLKAADLLEVHHNYMIIPSLVNLERYLDMHG